MALQSSGAISFSQLQAEFGGANPISISEYYRGGSYVPATKTTSTTVSQPSSGGYRYDSTYGWSHLTEANSCKAHWNGTDVFTNAPNSTTSKTVNGKTYYRGSQESVSPYGPREWGMYIYTYKIRRTYSTSSSTSVNTGIPSSGTISMNQFYGGTN